MAKAEHLIGALLPLALSACMNSTSRHEAPEVHGHRGCRGLLPENTVPGFLRAAELGVDWLELDVVISADGQVIVSHEPWMSHVICTDASGDHIPPEGERSFNLYGMTAAEIRAFDCGGLEHPRFPEQEQRRAHKPTLREVVEAIEETAIMGGGQPGFNIEIKSDHALYGTFQPRPDDFARIVLKEIDELGITDRCIIQSFDPAALMAAHAEQPDLAYALLVENDEGPEVNLSRLMFTPAIYSPHFSLADEALRTKLQEQGIELVVWTVNERADILRMIALGVDGIISDYPDRVIGLIDAAGR
ncbi:MAG: glycerophosphodiester phosphodiesterase [Flavobacteriales bacterium]|nr:glycerophosphodiester phosphodiesterase [Flavobacteriales bacterium]